MHTVIIDFSHFFHMAWHAALSAGEAYDPLELTLHNADGKLRTIDKSMLHRGIFAYHILFAEDRPATRKLNLFPDYRKGREDLSQHKNVLKQHLVQAGHAGHFFHSVGNEADDVIATLVRLASNNAQGNVTIMTSDRDLWQLIDSKVSVWNPISKLLIRQEDIFKAFAVRQPRHIPLYKSLWGDAGDCVPNAVPRTQKHLLPLILRGDGQLDTFRADVKQSWDSLSPRCRELYDLGAPQVQINWDLVYLDRHCTLVRE